MKYIKRISTREVKKIQRAIVLTQVYPDQLPGSEVEIDHFGGGQIVYVNHGRVQVVYLRHWLAMIT